MVVGLCAFTIFLLASLILPEIHDNDMEWPSGSLLFTIQEDATESSKNCSKSPQVQPLSRRLNGLTVALTEIESCLTKFKQSYFFTDD